MQRKFGLLVVCSTMLFITVATAPFGYSQETHASVYVIPRFSGASGSELILSNLNTKSVEADVTLLDQNGVRLSHIDVTVVAGSQTRLNSTFFASKVGSLVVNSAEPISVLATLIDVTGAFETVSPAINSDDSIIPFQGTAGKMDLTLFNPETSPITAVIIAIPPDGVAIAAAQRTIPPMGSITERVSTLFPPSTSGPLEIAYLRIRAISNVLAPSRHLHVQATVRDFGEPTLGFEGRRLDPAVLSAVTSSSAMSNPILPVFLQGDDYATMVQIVNASNVANSVTMMAFGPNGQAIPGTVAATVQLAANGSLRASVKDLFNLGQLLVGGSISFIADRPIFVTEGVGSVAHNAFVLTSAAPADTNFAFTHRRANSQSFTGLAVMNPNASAAHLSLRSMRDDGTLLGQRFLSLNAFGSMTRILTDILPETANGGFIYMSSDVPVYASALEGRTDNSLLANLPAMHSRPEYNPPNATSPGITNVTPLSITAGSPNTVVTVTGGPFDSTSQIVFDGTLLSTNLTSSVPPALQVTIAGSSLAVPRQASLFVRASNEGATVSSPPVTITIGSAAPTLSSLSNFPQPLSAGNPGFSMIVTGTKYVPGVTILIQGIPRPTIFENSTMARVTIPAEDLANGGVLQVTAMNPSPTTGPSNSLILPVVSPIANLSSISPTVSDVLLAADAAPLAITLTGSNFLPTARVLLNNVEVPAQFTNSSSLIASIPTSVLQVGGLFQISVRNPEPTPASAPALPLLINNATPVLSSVDPGSLTLDSVRTSPVSITLRGMNFGANSVFELTPPCGSLFVGNRVNSQEATLTIGIQCAGTYAVRVRTPQPGGGVSDTLSFIVQ